jgi:hypothetical protein
MLTRLDAEERLASIDGTALAFGSLEPKDADAVLDRLQAARDGVVPGNRKAAKASAADLSSMGIGFMPPPQEVPRG